MTREELYSQIVQTVSTLQRSHRHVYPWMVAMHLPDYRAEQTVRRDMARLAAAGVLVRVGGEGSRRGYVTPAYLMRQYKRKQPGTLTGLSTNRRNTNVNVEQRTYPPPPVTSALGTAPRSPVAVG